VGAVIVLHLKWEEGKEFPRGGLDISSQEAFESCAVAKVVRKVNNHCILIKSRIPQYHPPKTSQTNKGITGRSTEKTVRGTINRNTLEVCL
jgi:hypothetical protein